MPPDSSNMESRRVVLGVLISNPAGVTKGELAAAVDGDVPAPLLTNVLQRLRLVGLASNTGGVWRAMRAWQYWPSGRPVRSPF